MTVRDRPTIRRIYLDGATLNVSWYTVADSSITGYEWTLYYGVDTVFTSQRVAIDPAAARPPAITDALDLPGGALDTNTSYFVQVRTIWGKSPGQNPPSQLVPLITRLPVLRTGHFDGTDFYLEWEPSPQASQGYFLQLYRDSGNENPPNTTVPGPGDWWGKIKTPALSAGQWYAQVAAVGTVASDDGDQVYASNAASTLLAAQPSLTFSSARFQRGAAGGFITAQWTALAASTGVTRYRLQSYGPDGTPGAFADVPGVTSVSGTLPLPDSFAPGSTLRLLALNDEGMGVSTPAKPVLTTLPVLTAVAFAPDNKAVNVAWRVDPPSAVTGFTVEIYNLANPSQSSRTQAVSNSTSRSAAFSLAAGALDATQSWAVRVWATGAAGSVPAIGESWPLPAAAPLLTALACQGSELNVSWSLPANAAQPAAYVVSLTAGDKTASLRVEGARTTQARLLVPDASKSYSVTVRAVGPGDAEGPSSASATPLVAQVTGVKAVTDAISGKCTLSWAWTGTGTPGSYRLDFSDGTSATQNGTSHPLAGALPAGADLSVRITPLATTAGVAISGPATAPHRLPTLRATVVEARFDAAAMRVSATWAPMPGATGYRLALMASGALDDIASFEKKDAPEATRGSVDFPGGSKLDSTKRYLVLVQGRWGDDLGLPGTQPIFDPGFYVSTSSAETVPPFVYPATLITTATSANDAMTGEPLVLYLPDVGVSRPVTPEGGAFTLTANDDAARNKKVYPYVLTISNGTTNNPWIFGSRQGMPPESIRPHLVSGMRDFLQNVEAAGAKPWAIALIQQILARMLPQTFAEQLYYNFGLTFPAKGVASQGSVDLRPGMVLRVVPNPYQPVPGQAAYFTGYVGAACIDYDVGSLVGAKGWSVGFDTFIGQLVGNSALKVTPPAVTVGSGTEQGVAEAADLYFPAVTQSFYRLFVPTKLLTPTSVGSVTASDNFVLAMAPSYTSLCTATSAPSASSTVAYFRGRTVLKACLRVMLDGVGMVVPVGTTLANLLEQSGRLAPAVPPPLLGVRIERGLGGAVLDPNAPSHPASMAVHLDWQAADAAAYGAGWGVASLPLLPGDRITLE